MADRSVARVAAIPDALERARAAGVALAEAQSAIVALARLRAEAVRELRESLGWSHADVAAALGVSRPQAASIAKRGVPSAAG